MGTAIINHQAVAFMLADMAIGIELGRLMVRRAAWEYDQGALERSQAPLPARSSCDSAPAVRALPPLPFF